MDYSLEAGNALLFLLSFAATEVLGATSFVVSAALVDKFNEHLKKNFWSLNRIKKTLLEKNVKLKTISKKLNNLKKSLDTKSDMLTPNINQNLYYIKNAHLFVFFLH